MAPSLNDVSDHGPAVSPNCQHSPALLTATAWAKLLADRGDTARAVDVLTTALTPFPEDLDLPRVSSARRLLADLT